MSEMIERVARALARQYNIYHFDRAEDNGWEEEVDKARAAIEAMREPTEVMSEAGLSPTYIWVEETATPVWQRMIDAALE